MSEILDTDAHVKGDAFESRRMLLAQDGVGYSLHDTLVREGTEQRLHYKNHVESNYVFQGEGEVENLETGEVFPLGPGSLYVLDNHEPHLLRALKGDMRIVCVFTPALTGREVHDADGSYGLPEAPER
ncbi:ectoine synthase [Roseovarius sp. SCSIO 43702]|uniref:ectoine synthase n=1 Tax=Roseovarius sp. SCSIO 43702 TaxID=2823043 RepID=UPI001C72A374|nr:ectoine synthase [Roseovarius sp. SCSIO 43702]QYX56168.1 ectoine synthase [Roseovarius sp. SCSIO 43702]